MGISNSTSSIRGTGTEEIYRFARIQGNRLVGNSLQATTVNFNQATINKLSAVNASLNNASTERLKVRTSIVSNSATFTNASINRALVRNHIGINATITNMRASSVIASYLNFTATRGSNGVGLRYQDGKVEERKAGDVWRPLGTASEKTWPFASLAGGSGTFYFGGFYSFSGSNDDFSATPAQTWGTADTSYAAHFMVVLGETAVDKIVLRVKGTRITDGGVRTAAYEATLAIPDVSATNFMKETPEKFIGQVTVRVISGTAKNMNYGWAKYWDNNNNNFTVTGLEALWLGGGNDSAPDIRLRHHKDSGWTYNAGADPTPPTSIAAMVTDHVTEIEVRNGEEGAWKRDNLSTDVDGNNTEGTIIEIVTTANNTFRQGSFMMRIEPRPNN